MEPVMRKRWQLVTGAALLLCATGFVHPALAQDFFFNLFGGFGARPHGPPRMVLPFGNDGPPAAEASRPRNAYGGGQAAWCVRTCDGRYFPITGKDVESR